MKTNFSLQSTIQKKSTRPYRNEIPSHFINEIKAKGYKVIGFNVFLISLLADPGEGPAPSPSYFKTKRRPEGPKKILGRPGPRHLKVSIRHCSLMRSLSPKRLIWSRLYYFYSLYPLQEKGLNILSIVTWFWNNKTCKGMRSIRSATNRESESLDGHLREILRHTKDTSFRPRASPEGEVSVESKTKIQWRRTL